MPKNAKFSNSKTNIVVPTLCHDGYGLRRVKNIKIKNNPWVHGNGESPASEIAYTRVDRAETQNITLIGRTPEKGRNDPSPSLYYTVRFELTRLLPVLYSGHTRCL